MDEQRFIEKYKDKEITVKTYKMGDLSTYLIFIDDKPLEGLEEDIFWGLLPNTQVIFSNKDTEILKLVV